MAEKTNKVEEVLKDRKDSTKDFTNKEKEDGKLMGILSYIIPLIPYFVEKENKFVRYHAIQGMNLLIVSVIYGVAYSILSFILAFIPIIGWIAIFLIGLLGFGILALCIMGIIDVCNGQARELPIINKCKFIKK